jgi:lysozyme
MAEHGYFDPMEKLFELVKRHEGLRLYPYIDTRGLVSIGWGRNLNARGIDQEEAQAMLTRDLYDAVAFLMTYPWWSALSLTRQIALTDMAFNLGEEGFKKFHRMLGYLALGEFANVAAEMRASLWCRENSDRVEEDARIIETGEL